MVLSEDEAKVIALNEIERMAQGSVPLGLLDSATQADADGWHSFTNQSSF